MSLILLTIILAIIFLIFAYLLFVPISVRLDIQIDKKVAMIPEIKIFPFRHRIARKKTKKDEKPPKPPRAKKIEIKKQKRLDFTRLGRADLPIIFQVVSEVMKFAGRLIKAPHYSLKADIAGGASEPDITGEIYGAYQAIRFALPESISISYCPDFAVEKFKGTVKVGLVIRIIRLLKETLVFIFRLPIIKLIKLYRKLRKEG